MYFYICTYTRTRVHTYTRSYISSDETIETFDSDQTKGGNVCSAHKQTNKKTKDITTLCFINHIIEYLCLYAHALTDSSLIVVMDYFVLLTTQPDDVRLRGDGDARSM